MPNKKTPPANPIDAIKHADRRATIPTDDALVQVADALFVELDKMEAAGCRGQIAGKSG